MQSVRVHDAGKNDPLLADPKFKHRLSDKYSAATMKFCYQCGTCTAACPIAKILNIYSPNKIIELANLGVRNLPQSNAFLFCSACMLCTNGCPQGVGVHEIMQGLKELADDDANIQAFLSNGFDDALEALGREMPFPITYSWVCLYPSDKNPFGSAVKKALESSLKRTRPQRELPDKDATKIAVIGSGPAGLTAAWELAKNGFAVTVFERLQELGGMLRNGIPSFRLPKDVVDTEIDRIKDCGVQMKPGTLVEQGFFEEIVKGGDYAAVFIASGAGASRKLGIEGEDLQGVVSALDFLREFNTTGTAKVGKHVIVIGAGNVAMDAAGSAKRCGAETVRLFCRRDYMRAHDWEIHEIIEDGVEINPRFGPKAFLGDGERVTGVEFVGYKSVYDADGKFNPVIDEKATQTVEADTVITAIGQGPDLSFLGKGVGTFRGVVQADPYTMETDLPGVFAGGDAVLGPASLVEAIATGKKAADSIMRYLNAKG